MNKARGSNALRVERHEKFWAFTLSRPEKRNALSSELVESLISNVEEAERLGVPLLVFKGEGRNFSAGFDFTDYEASSEGDLLLRFVRIETLLQKIAFSPCLTLALAHGTNFGAGVDLIASCRVRVAAPESKFCMPGLKFGLALGTSRFGDIVGLDKACELLRNTRIFDSDEALRIRFLHGIREQADWETTISHYAQEACALSPRSRSLLFELTSARTRADCDMATLVRSASEPGLKERIRQFRAEK